jgi:hypothetical protein
VTVISKSPPEETQVVRPVGAGLRRRNRRKVETALGTQWGMNGAVCKAIVTYSTGRRDFCS